MKAKELHKSLKTELDNYLEVKNGLFSYESMSGFDEMTKADINNSISQTDESEDNHTGKTGFSINYNRFKDENDKNQILKAVENEIKRLAEETFKISRKEKYYWELCSFSTYQETYADRLNDFLEKNDNELFNESTFIDNEIKSIEYFKKIWYVNLLTNNTKEQIEKSFIKKLIFLENKKSDGSNNLEEILDLNSSKISEKIIFLYELGILDYLSKQKPFNTSKNSMASAISGIIGEPARSIQSAINPIFNSTVSQKNNPLNTKSSVQKIKQKLIQIGFEIKQE